MFKHRLNGPRAERTGSQRPASIPIVGRPAKLAVSWHLRAATKVGRANTKRTLLFMLSSGRADLVRFELQSSSCILWHHQLLLWCFLLIWGGQRSLPAPDNVACDREEHQFTEVSQIWWERNRHRLMGQWSSGQSLPVPLRDFLSHLILPYYYF